jgi:tryptophan halogenase
MGFRTATDVGALSPQARQAQAAFLENQRQTQRLRAGLPRHRELIDKIMTHGLSAV